MADLSADPFASAAHSHMATHLCGPFRAGAADTALPVQPDGTIHVAFTVRDPILLVAPAKSLDDVVCRISAVVDPGGAASPLAPPVQFAPYSEAGAFVPLYAPVVGPPLRTSLPFTVRVHIAYTDRDGNPLSITVADASQHVQAHVLEGVMGKIIYILGAEKARLRRQAREIAAMRVLAAGRGDVLDRFGADAGVARFADRLRFDAAKKEIVSETRADAGGHPVAEPDAEYLRRLRPYYAWMFGARPNLLNLLNGPGAPGDPNRGLPGALGVDARFILDERNNDFAVAVHLVAPGSPPLLANFRQFLGDFILIWPNNTPANNLRHQKRYVSSARRAAVEDLRTRLRTALNFTVDTAIGEALGLALLNVAALRSALGITGKISVTRGFDPASGSRYELGLGVNIAPLAAAELDDLNTRLTGPTPPRLADPNLDGLLRSAVPKPSAADPEGAWLFQAAGIRTVHRVDTNTVYLSHLPIFGLVVTEGTLSPNQTLPLEARYQAPGDPGANVVLELALVHGAAQWTAAGHQPFTRIPHAAAAALWNSPTAQPPAARNVFAAAGLPAVADLTKIASALNGLPGELVEAIELPVSLADEILAGNEAAVGELKALADLFRAEGVSSILPFVSGPHQVAVLLAAIGLPQAGINLSERVSAGFRWYAVPIQGGGGSLGARGSRSSFQPSGPGLTAIVVLGYARSGLVDPYEFKVDLPDGARLNIEQYEYLMNLLERACPLGIQVNTFSIRQAHVDLDGDGKADPLPPSIFRTFRKFQRRRQRGEIGVGLAPET
jgi:hypothetical protein